MSKHKLANIQPKRILVITMRYLGDALLVTPLISSLRQAYPSAQIHVVLPKANEGMFEGNLAIDKIIPLSNKSNLFKFGLFLMRIFKYYDLAISTQAGDRPILTAIVAGKKNMGFVADKKVKNRWKWWFLSCPLPLNNKQIHAVLENLRFCNELNIKPSHALTPPNTTEYNISLRQKFVVLHIMPQWHYKQWQAEKWVKLGYYLQQKGFLLVLTGSSQFTEITAVKNIVRKLPPSTKNMAGQLSLAQLSCLLAKASLFIGPDTGITHLAAATGVKTVALFGPTDPLKWGPWPIAYAGNQSPFASQGIQQVANICLIQGQSEKNCVPCQQEGCNKNRNSQSDCLDILTVETVIMQIEHIVLQSLENK